MKKHIAIVALLALVASLSIVPAFGQAAGSVKGVCKDQQGSPIANANVEWFSTDTGRKYQLKTNNKGEYFSLGISPGKYTVTLSKDGKEIYHFNNVTVTLDETTLDFDLKKEFANAAAGKGANSEQIKQAQEQQAKVQKENLTIKALNEHLAQSNEAIQAGNYDQAVTILAEATQMDPSRDLLWFKLGDANRLAANKQTDPAEKQKRYDEAIQDYQKAIQLKGGQAGTAAPAQAPPAQGQAAPAQGQPAPAQGQTAPGQSAGAVDPKNAQTLGAYYNNLAEVYAKSGKVDDAVKSYQQAAQLNPSGAAQYTFNEGAVLTNAGKVDDAIQAFDKVIAADPNKADAYYWKGVNMIGKATLKGDKMVAPEGTAEAFNKYLELDPTGKYADPAKQMLASIGASVQTSFGNKKKSTTKK
ncbi:MAG TPA: tetratricopeptide repeat protein [Terriglobales bacterium]|nr:tetratricopeptide repeat protein [Terriglobales bacterium]